jgi:hypothetical protein
LQNERQAAHINDLLKTYALRASVIIGPQRAVPVVSVRRGEPGELFPRENRGQQSIAVRSQWLSLFGVDPFVRYECPSTGRLCTTPTHRRQPVACRA